MLDIRCFASAIITKHSADAYRGISSAGRAAGLQRPACFEFQGNLHPRHKRAGSSGRNCVLFITQKQSSLRQPAFAVRQQKTPRESLKASEGVAYYGVLSRFELETCHHLPGCALPTGYSGKWRPGSTGSNRRLACDGTVIQPTELPGHDDRSSFMLTLTAGNVLYISRKSVRLSSMDYEKLKGPERAVQSPLCPVPDRTAETIYKRKTPTSLSTSRASGLELLSDSNWRPHPYQGCALPTEA